MVDKSALFSNLSLEATEALGSETTNVLDKHPEARALFAQIDKRTKSESKATRIKGISGKANAQLVERALRAAAKEAHRGIRVKLTQVERGGRKVDSYNLVAQSRDERVSKPRSKAACTVCGRNVTVTQKGEYATHGPQKSRCSGGGNVATTAQVAA